MAIGHYPGKAEEPVPAGLIREIDDWITAVLDLLNNQPDIGSKEANSYTFRYYQDQFAELARQFTIYTTKTRDPYYYHLWRTEKRSEIAAALIEAAMTAARFFEDARRPEGRYSQVNGGNVISKSLAHLEDLRDWLHGG